MSNIKLNDEVSINIENLIQTGMVIMANSGAGKSYTIRRIAEQAVKNIQVIILDPEGEFASLREQFDFILAGKNADVPVEIRSAGLLATKLLELEKSAIIDLYELHPQERQRYVKLFCEAIVNCPKNLYHPVLIILDEAHEYVPEGKPSEATWAVESLASRGRKRGQRLILATQRIAKISKNATAEANNKLIGRASQDIDMKRAGDELGFNKEKLVLLRQLKPGEFYAFGPSISEEIIKIKVGEVKTQHAKVGYKGGNKTPPPSAVIKSVLNELKNLPQEAEIKLKTEKELKKRISELERELMIVGRTKHTRIDVIDKTDTKAIEKAVKIAVMQKERDYDKERNEMIRQTNNFLNIIKDIGKYIAKVQIEKIVPPTKSKLSQNHLLELDRYVYRKPIEVHPEIDLKVTPTEPESKAITGGALRMLEVLVSRYPVKLSKVQLATFSKMKSSSGTFGSYMSTLKTSGLIENEGDLWQATPAGMDFLGKEPSPPQTPEEIREMWKNNLKGGARRMFEVLVRDYPSGHTKENLAFETAMIHTSGTFGSYLSILKSNNLATISSQGEITAAEHLF